MGRHRRQTSSGRLVRSHRRGIGDLCVSQDFNVNDAFAEYVILRERLPLVKRSVDTRKILGWIILAVARLADTRSVLRSC